MKKYRDNGAIGALLDEYEKAVNELLDLIDGVSPSELTTIADHKTEDLDCRSIQTILSHVVDSGYNYVIVIRKHLKEEIDYKHKTTLHSIKEYRTALVDMFQYNVALFEDHPNLKIYAPDAADKIKTRWGQLYDVEQLFEHAILHVLRHRRQIERFLIRLRNDTA